jgi:hypothetical protein
MAVTTSIVVNTTSIISFDSHTKVVTWHTNSNLYAGTYIITITGTIIAA